MEKLWLVRDLILVNLLGTKLSCFSSPPTRLHRFFWNLHSFDVDLYFKGDRGNNGTLGLRGRQGEFGILGEPGDAGEVGFQGEQVSRRWIHEYKHHLSENAWVHMRHRLFVIMSWILILSPSRMAFRSVVSFSWNSVLLLPRRVKLGPKCWGRDWERSGPLAQPWGSSRRERSLRVEFGWPSAVVDHFVLFLRWFITWHFRSGYRRRCKGSIINDVTIFGAWQLFNVNCLIILSLLLREKWEAMDSLEKEVFKERMYVMTDFAFFSDTFKFVISKRMLFPHKWVGRVHNLAPAGNKMTLILVLTS